MNKFLNDNKDDLIIIVISIIALVVGCMSVGPLLAFIVIGLADAALFVPNIIKNRNKEVKGRHVSFEKKKTPKKKKEKEIKKPKEKKIKKKKSIWKKLLLIFLIFIIICIIGFCVLAAYIVINAPKFDPDKLYQSEPSILYDIDGNEFAQLGSENRKMISYDELPEVLVDAIIATEDSRFFQHNGFDLPRFTKATLQTLLGSSSAGGASTLTMQLVKNHFTSTDKNLTRKFTDIYMAIYQVEKNYTKEEILEFYVNAPYLGGGAYGVEQACQTYFGKSAKDINLAEAALIAGLFQSPGSDDPTRYPENAEARRKIVLKLMEKHGYITKEEREIAEQLTVDKLLVDDDSSDTNEYQGFIDTVVEELLATDDENLNPYNNSLDIYTTMDRDKQDYINKVMNGENYNWHDEKVEAGVAVVDVKTGELRAVGAGRNKTTARTFNFATQLNNQIGSTAKPLYEYAVGIEYENWSTYEPFTDENITYSDGTALNNHDGTYKGFLTLRQALAQSRNTSAVKAFKKNSNENIKKTVQALGLHPEIDSTGYIHQAHAIGGYTGECPLTMAAAYATFANGGTYNSPHSYTKVVNRQTEEETKVEVTTNKVFSKQTAYMMTSLLQSAAKEGLHSYYNVNGVNYGAKTGTSNFDTATKKARNLPDDAVNDYWVNGITPDYAISIWYGYEKPNSKYHNSYNSLQHAKFFQKIAKGIFTENKSFENPGGVSSVAVEKETYPAKKPSEYTPSNLIVTELFKSGTEPTEVSDRFSKLSDVTNLTGTVSNNEVKLSWTAIKTPSAIDDDAIKNLAKQLYETTGWQNKFISSRKSYMGNLVYKIYSKDSNGNLELIDSTSDTSISIPVTPNSASTYVVKTSYTKFTANASDGVETTVSLAGVTSQIKLELNGDNPLTASKNNYTEAGITIYENNEKTDYQPTSITYVNTATNTPVTIDIMKSTPGTYTATYNYNSDSITRSITITD